MNSDAGLLECAQQEPKWQSAATVALRGPPARAGSASTAANAAPPGSSGCWKRSDQDIANAALNALRRDVQVPHDNIDVTVNAGRATLTGTVDAQCQMDAAERCVRCLIDVVAVRNDIAVQPTADWSDMKCRIEDAFQRNSRTVTSATNHRPATR